MSVYFTKEHEWVKVEGNTGTMGITNYAAHELGDITFVELPKVGKQIKMGEALCTVESVKAASEIFAPVSGKVTEINKALESSPQIVNEKAESDGWMSKLELANPSEVSSLMNKSQYDEYIKGL